MSAYRSRRHGSSPSHARSITRVPRHRRTYALKVSNISSKCPLHKVEERFKAYGSCDVVRSQSVHHTDSVYFVYVNYYSFSDASQAVKENGSTVWGVPIRVKFQDDAYNDTSTSQAAPTQYTVKVTNIAKSISEDELQKLFSFYGKNPCQSLKLNTTSGEANFAYVNYYIYSDANKAVNEINGSTVKGLKLQVKHHGSSGNNHTDSCRPEQITSSCSVKVILSGGPVLPTVKELSDYFSMFGELASFPIIKPGSPPYAYVNFKQSICAANAAQQRSLEIKPGVTVQVRLQNSAKAKPHYPTTQAVVAPQMIIPTASSLCESRFIACNALSVKILTSEDPKYVIHRASIAPVSLTSSPNGNGVNLFGEVSRLPGAVAVVALLVNELARDITEKLVEFPTMYIPAFSNQALMDSLCSIQQKHLVECHVCVSPVSTQDLSTFSSAVSAKFRSSEAIKVSEIGLYQDPSPTSAIPAPASLVWSWKDDDRTYKAYDPVSNAQLNRGFQSDPHGIITITTNTVKNGQTSYIVNFSTMRQTNVETGHPRKIKSSSNSTSSVSANQNWFYEDDHKKMVPYTASQCVEIESIFINKAAPQLVTINGKQYSFDFIRMKQINMSTRYERSIERRASLFPVVEKIFKVKISGLQQSIDAAEYEIKQELENILVVETHSLPPRADSAFQKQLNGLLQEYFVTSSIEKNQIKIQGVRGYVEKILFLVQSKCLELERKIVSRQLSSSSLGAPVPSEWDAQTEQVLLKGLSRFNSEWSEVAGLVHKTLPSAHISSIERIQNQWLWDRYSFAKTRMHERNSGVVNEKKLFHGTRETPPDKIYRSEQGFDFRFCSQGMWGTGSYFAVNASYSDRYCYRSRSSLSGNKKLILALVLTGETCRCASDSSLKKPPVKPSKGHGNFEDERYDSVSGHTNGSDVFIVYDHEKAYPYYLITYTA